MSGYYFIRTDENGVIQGRAAAQGIADALKGIGFPETSPGSPTVPGASVEEMQSWQGKYLSFQNGGRYFLGGDPVVIYLGTGPGGEDPATGGQYASEVIQLPNAFRIDGSLNTDAHIYYMDRLSFPTYTIDKATGNPIYDPDGDTPLLYKMKNVSGQEYVPLIGWEPMSDRGIFGERIVVARGAEWDEATQTDYGKVVSMEMIRPDGRALLPGEWYGGGATTFATTQKEPNPLEARVAALEVQVASLLPPSDGGVS